MSAHNIAVTPGIKTVYINGRYLATSEAVVSVFDRGFIFGDGVYEVIPVYGGRPLRLEQHFARLAQSLAAVRIADPHTPGEWRKIFARLIETNERGAKGDQSIYLQITRGVAPRDHAFPKNTVPTVMAYAQPLNAATLESLQGGLSAVTLEDIRWARCDIKATALLANALLRQQAAERGAAEAILIRNGLITEGAASNIFIVTDGRLRTPPKGPRILPGITRDLILEIARAHELAADEEDIATETLFAADEVWMTSSTREIAPITRIDDRPVGGGHAGPLFARLYRLYQDYKAALRAGEAQ